MTARDIAHLSPDDIAAIGNMTKAQADSVKLTQGLLAHRWRLRYDIFLRDGLGFGAADFPQFNADPGVGAAIAMYSAALLDWIKNRKQQKYRKNILVCQPRETAKTSCYTAPTPIWALCHDYNLATLIMSAEFDRGASKMVQGIRAHLEGSDPNSKLIPVFGQFANAKRTWTDTKMVIAQRTGTRLDPSISTYSVETGAVGSHVQVAVLDDLIGKAQLLKHGDKWLDKVWEQYIEMNTIVTRDGLLVVVGTRYHENDLIGRIIKHSISPQVRSKVQLGAPVGTLPEDFDTRWPEYANRYSDWTVIYGQGFTKAADGTATYHYPVIWTPEAIAKAEEDGERGAAWVAAQIQNNPGSRSDNPITDEVIARVRMRVADVPRGAYGNLSLHCDLAFKSEDAYLAQRGDWCVMQVWGHLDGHVYLLRQWHGRVTAQLFINAWLGQLDWATYICKSPIRVMTMDKTIGGTGTATRDLFLNSAAKAGKTCPPILELTRSKKKVEAILAVAGFWQDGRVHVVDDVEGVEDLFYEMRNLGYSEFDDHADTAKDVFADGIYAPGARVPFGTAAEDAASRWNWPVAVYDGSNDSDNDSLGESTPRVVRDGRW